MDNEIIQWRLRYSRLHGEFMGFMRGLAFWDLPEELMETVIKIATEKEAQYEKLMHDHDMELPGETIPTTRRK